MDLLTKLLGQAKPNQLPKNFWYLNNAHKIVNHEFAFVISKQHFVNAMFVLFLFVSIQTGLMANPQALNHREVVKNTCRCCEFQVSNLIEGKHYCFVSNIFIRKGPKIKWNFRFFCRLLNITYYFVQTSNSWLTTSSNYSWKVSVVDCYFYWRTFKIWNEFLIGENSLWCWVSVLELLDKKIKA